MDCVAIYLSDSEEENVYNCAIQRKTIRDKSNIMEMPAKKFIKNFRLTKDAFMYVLNEIKENLKTPLRSTSVPNIVKLAATLRFLAEGGYQQSVGQDMNIGIAQQTTSYILSEVFTAIETKLCPLKINFYMTDEEKQVAKLFFFKKGKIPGVIGAIDGTHIQMIRPTKDEHLFLNRKFKHSINAMAICDHNTRIRAVDASFPGASHDSHVWSLSKERGIFEERYKNGDKSSWLLGDSAYPLEPWMLTPYRVAPDGSDEAHFNETHSKLRNIIERTFGIVKGRFRCLLAARELHYSPPKCVQIFNVCCALHNICLDFKIPLSSNLVIYEDDSSANIHVDIAQETTLSREAEKIRENIKVSLTRHDN